MKIYVEFNVDTESEQTAAKAIELALLVTNLPATCWRILETQAVRPVIILGIPTVVKILNGETVNLESACLLPDSTLRNHAKRMLQLNGEAEDQVNL